MGRETEWKGLAEADLREALNTDKELWREVTGDYYSPSIHLTREGSIGINVGGHVIVRTVQKWHESMAACDALKKKHAALVAAIRETDHNHVLQAMSDIVMLKELWRKIVDLTKVTP